MSAIWAKRPQLFTFLTAAAAVLALSACDDDNPSSSGPEAQDATVSVDFSHVLPTGDTGPEGPSADAAVTQVQVAITSPAPGTALSTRRVTVSGTASPVSHITLNGERVNVTDGAWSTELTLEEGEHTLTAQAEHTQNGTQQTAEDRIDLTIDLTPPIIRITDPLPGLWLDSEYTDLRFTVEEGGSGLAELSRMGLPIDLASGPNFALNQLLLDEGLNLLRLEAADRAGNRVTEHVAVHTGPMRSPDETVDGALRLQVGPEGLESLAEVAKSLLASQDLVEMIPNPIVASPVPLWLQDISYQELNIEFELRANELYLKASLEQVQIQIGIGGDGTPNDLSFPITVGADRIELTGVIIPSVQNGQLHIEVPEDRLDVQLVHLVFSLTGAPDFGDDPNQQQTLIEEMISAGLSYAIGQLVPQALQQVLGLLEEPVSFELLGAELGLRFIPERAIVSPSGLAIHIGVGVDLNTPPNPPSEVAGYFTTPTVWGGVPAVAGIAVAVDDDFINALLYRIWQSGVLLPVIDREFLAQAGSELALVHNLLKTLARQAEPELPSSSNFKLLSNLPLPILVRVEKGSNDQVGLMLGLGGARFDVALDDAEGRVVVEGHASLKGTAQVGAQQLDDGRLGLLLSEPEFDTAFDVSSEHLRGVKEQSIEGTMNNLLDSVGGLLPALLSGVAIPAIDGLSIERIRADVVPNDPNFLLLELELGAGTQP